MNNFYSINVNQIQQNRYERDRCKYSTYKKILEKCYFKIKNCSDKDEKYCIYQIPEFIFGEPLFNKYVCAKYMLEHLQDNGFNCKSISNIFIFITWHLGNERKFEGFRKTNQRFEKPKMIDYKEQAKERKINNEITIDTMNQNEKFRIINDYIPTKPIFFKKP